MSFQGKAIIFSAPSGAGKTTIVKHLIKTLPELQFSISATTRTPRPNEQHGKDYYFLTADEFKKRIQADELYEYEEVYEGMFYGTLKSEVERIWEAGKHVIFDVDVVGGLNLRESIGDRAKSIFVGVKNIDVLEQRLKARETESEETLKKRVGKAAKEMERSPEFDYVLINDKLDQALAEAEQVVKNFIQS